jgi:adenosylcobinamide-GDP ribazoletransferase
LGGSRVGGEGSSPWWAPITGSVGFLTILPVPQVDLPPAQLTRAIALFPLVGTLLGALLGALGLLLDRVLPAGPTAALLLAAGAIVTGGLHLDGLIDTADAFGGKTPEQRLAIMRDSRVGAFGVIAGALVILAQFACLSALTGFARLVALILGFTLSRWAMLLALGLFPAARPEGLGAAFHAAATGATLIVGTLIAVAVALAFRELGLVALVVGAAVTLGCGRLLARRLGGLTGDACGALAAATETAALFVAVAMGAR